MGKRDASAISGEVVPEGQGKLVGPVSIRMPERLLQRIEKCAKETDNSRNDAVVHLLTWGIEAYEKKGSK